MNYTKESKITKEMVKNMPVRTPARRLKNINDMRAVLLLRIDGYTLEDIAKCLKLTKERIRQIEALGVEICKNNAN